LRIKPHKEKKSQPKIHRRESIFKGKRKCIHTHTHTDTHRHTQIHTHHMQVHEHWHTSRSAPPERLIGRLFNKGPWVK
jgi:hypothetical protein